MINKFSKANARSKKICLSLLASVAVVIVCIALYIPPIPQPAAYHDFADKQHWLGLANAVNVLSNVPVILVGLVGLYLLLIGKIQFTKRSEGILWAGVATGLIFSGLGSWYYHLAPNNSRLVWDRLGISTTFMSLAAA